MKLLIVACLVACIGMAWSVDCGSKTKQKLTFIPTNPFYTPKFWADTGSSDDPRDAIEMSGRKVDIKTNACYRVKAAVPSDLIKICAATKKATKVSFQYQQYGSWYTGKEFDQPEDEFHHRCFNVKDEFPGSNVLPDVESVQICFESDNAMVRLKQVRVNMCAA